MCMMATRGGPAFAPPQRTTAGDAVGLCLLIDFNQVQASIARDEVEQFCTQPGYSGFGNNGSVRDSFFDSSLGDLLNARELSGSPRHQQFRLDVLDARQGREPLKMSHTCGHVSRRGLYPRGVWGIEGNFHDRVAKFLTSRLVGFQRRAELAADIDPAGWNR